VVSAVSPITYNSGTQTIALGTAPNGVATANINDSAVSAIKIADRTRRFLLSNGAFVGAGSGSGVANFGATPARNQAAALALGNNSSNVVTATFVVPQDYVAGQALPKLTIFWATDDGGASRQVDVDVSFTNLTSISSSSTGVTFRYNFRQNSGASTNAMDSLNPGQGEVVSQTLPEGAENYDNSPALWAPGDVIVLSIGRNGSSGSDPNSGNMYIYAVTFSYTADM
jgi:hypothetical protein